MQVQSWSIYLWLMLWLLTNTSDKNQQPIFNGEGVMTEIYACVHFLKCSTSSWAEIVLINHINKYPTHMFYLYANLHFYYFTANSSLIFKGALIYFYTLLFLFTLTRARHSSALMHSVGTHVEYTCNTEKNYRSLINHSSETLDR